MFLKDIKKLPKSTDWERFRAACGVYQALSRLSSRGEGGAPQFQGGDVRPQGDVGPRDGETDDGDGAPRGSGDVPGNLSLRGGASLQCDIDSWGTALMRFFESKILEGLELGGGPKRYGGTSLNNWIRHDTALIREIYFPQERQLFGTRDDPHPRGGGYHRKAPGPVRVAVEIRAWGSKIYLDVGILEHPSRSLPSAHVDVLGFDLLAAEFIRTHIVDEGERARRDPRCKIKGRWYVMSTIPLDSCTLGRLEEELLGYLGEMKAIRALYESHPSAADRDNKFVRIKGTKRKKGSRSLGMSGDAGGAGLCDEFPAQSATQAIAVASPPRAGPAPPAHHGDGDTAEGDPDASPSQNSLKLQSRSPARSELLPGQRASSSHLADASIQTEGVVVILMPGQRIITDHHFGSNSLSESPTVSAPSTAAQSRASILDWGAGILISDPMPSFHLQQANHLFGGEVEYLPNSGEKSRKRGRLK